MKENTLLVLSGKDLKKNLTMKDCVEAMKGAFTALSNGEVDVPLRTAIDMKADNGGALFMPVYSSDISKVGLKTVMINRDNPGKGLPFIHAMVMVFDSTTGAPVALMDGEVITAMRTGAVSGLATSLLARNDAETAAVIGTGAQGETQLEGVCAVRNIKKTYVFDRDQKRAEAYAAKMSQKLEIDVIAAENNQETLSKADVICTSTSSPVPVFNHTHIKPGVHINGVGAYRRDMAEVPPEIVQRAKVIVDQREGCLAEAGDITQAIEQGIITESHIHGDLGELVSGKVCGREHDDEVTFFKSVGVAIQDLVTADLAMKLAEQKGVGQKITI